MINIAICDDEKIQRDILRKALSTLLELRGVDYKINEFDCGESLLGCIPQTAFDILFLDIEMKALDGIATARNIRNYHKSSVIVFITAYPDFVFQGYEVKALNYILKPYSTEKLTAVLDAAMEEIKRSQDQYYAIELKSGTYKLCLNDTLYFTSDKRKVIAVTASGTLEFYDKLDLLQTRLPAYFIRIHQRYLVNINHVNTIEKGSAGVRNELLPVSRSRQQELMIAFAKTMLN